MFIELTMNTNRKISINIPTVSSFSDNDGQTVIYFVDGEPIFVKESYEEIQTKLKEVGVDIF